MTDALLTRFKAEAVSIGAGATKDYIVPTGGATGLVVMANMSGAANGDLGVKVTPYEADNTTVFGLDLPDVQHAGPTFASPNVFYYGMFDVTAVDQVRVRITNNNAGGQTINRISWRTQ